MSGFTIDELKLAFGYHIVRLIIGADTLFDLGEIQFLERHFPRRLMDRVGFLDAEGDFSPRHTEAMREALERLPRELSVDARLEFLTLFFEAGLSDDVFDSEEASIIAQAAKLLGVSDDDFERHVDALPGVGRVDLPEPE